VCRVSLKGINWAVVLARLKTETGLDFNCLSLVSLEDVALLGTDEILEGARILIILQRRTTEDLGYRLIIDLECFRENKFIDRAIAELLHVPPKNASVS
jgi:hypothetical protein